jgi:YidC/Oxa1 family membrane protein insertase
MAEKALKTDKAMKDMKKIQPQIDALREKYKSNPEELNKLTMELYKEHKVNPFGSCLPLLIQMPILFALFGVLRQIPDAVTNVNFLVWDLTIPDPFYVLPILNGAMTFFQQKNYVSWRTTKFTNEINDLYYAINDYVYLI